MPGKLIKNTLFLMVSNYMGMLGSAVLTIALARYLGAHGLGVFSTVFTFVFFGSLLSILLVELNDLQPLLRYLALIKPS